MATAAAGSCQGHGCRLAVAASGPQQRQQQQGWKPSQAAARQQDPAGCHMTLAGD